MEKWFEKVVGKENVGYDVADKEVYGTDASRINGVANIVVFPTEAKQVQQIILYAKRGKLNLVCRGGGSSLTGAVSANKAVVLDFSKMNKILKFSGDFVVVEPGINIDVLNRFLALKGKCFPVVPSSSKVSTIGGMVSTNASGMKDRLHYGRMNDWVAEVEIYDGTGKRRTLKSEFCGTEGNIGAITKIKLNVTEPIKERSMSVLKIKDIEKLVENVVNLRWNKKVLNLEFIDSISAVNSGLDKTNYLIIEYEGSDGDILDAREMSRIWQKRQNSVVSLFAKGYLSDEDPIIPLENMAEFLYWLKKRGIPSYGHIGLGIIHANFKTRELLDEFYSYVLSIKGEISGEYGYGILRKKYMPMDLKTKILEMKRKHDPDGLFNSGKIDVIKVEDTPKESKRSRWMEKHFAKNIKRGENNEV